MSGPELARRLEVSPRSVRRYIAMFQDMGIPIEGERGRYGQYRLCPGYKLPPLTFDDDEALALTVGLLLVRRSGGLVEPATTERALAKLNRVLPEGVRGQVLTLQETLVLDAYPEQVLPDSAKLTLLSQGVKTHQRVWLHYRNEQGSATEREVDPYGVVQRGGRWYVAGYCHLRQDLRVFRVDRMDEVRLFTIAFEPPEDFDVSTYVGHAVAMVPTTYTVEVLLKTSLARAQRELYPNFVTLTPDPDGVLLHCTTDTLAWMARVIAGFSFAWEVREPPELEEALRAHASNLLEQLKKLATSE